MKKITQIGMLVIACLFISAIAISQSNSTIADIATERTYVAADRMAQPAPIPLKGGKGLLFENGPIVTDPGGGPGGADYSLLENPPFTVWGYAVYNSGGYRLADDFEITGTAWDIDSIIVYGYQTNSPTTSSFTGFYIQIWDGDPSAGGTVIWGDLTTNVLDDTYWSNCYRGSDLTNSQRPVMRIVTYVSGLTLDPSTYWIDYTLEGSLSSGPWGPPVTIWGTYDTGDGMQYTGTWALLDNGGYTQGVPFEIWGPSAVLEPPTNLACTVTNQDVHLTWDPPISNIEELIYDDGVPTGSYSYVGYTMASQMSPLAPCKILVLKYYTTVGDTTGDLSFEPRVFDWAGTMPGTTILYETTADAVEDDWLEVDISAHNITVTDDFMVGFGSTQGNVYMGYNTTDNGRSWDWDGTNWAQWNETYFLRAIVEYSKGDIVELSPVKVVPIANIPPDMMVEHKRDVSVEHSNPPVPNLGSRALLGYNAYRDVTKVNSSIITDLFYDDLDVEPGTYDYTVTAVYDEGESEPSNICEAHIAGVSVNEIGRQTIQFYPNPASGFINVKSDFNITNVEVLSFTGKTVYTNPTIDSKNARINVSNLSSGVYLMKVTTTKEILTRKITVTR